MIYWTLKHIFISQYQKTDKICLITYVIQCKDYNEINENYRRDVIKTVHFHYKCVSIKQ